MTKKLELYKCNICGNIVEVLVPGMGDLVCCDEKMKLLEPKNSEQELEMTEKHSPEIDVYEEGTVVRVTNHPMERNHYIMFIQAASEDKNEIHTKFFSECMVPEIKLPETKNIKNARSYCNIHGLYNNKG